MRVALAQIAPRLLDRKACVRIVAARIREAANQGAKLVAFGETVIPGYPVWLSRTDGARFDDPDQKRLHARYLEQAVCLEDGDLEPVQKEAARAGVHVIVGVAERPRDRGGHSLFCSRVMLGPDGAVLSVHRKLMPTYEERLSWSAGDGAGLVVHPVGPFHVGALNCWENWMPLARAALHAQGEDVHVMLWPGCERLTTDITRFAAREGRSYVLSASALVREQDLPEDLPLRERMATAGETLYDGGSCIAAPDGTWLIKPQVGTECLVVADLDPKLVRAERQNFDPSGHYARPDVLELRVDRRRQRAAEFRDG